MSSQYKQSCTSAPSQWQRHHAIQADATCTIPSNKRRLFNIFPFSKQNYMDGVTLLKNNKAVGRDYVLGEQRKNLGPKAYLWRLTMMTKCFIENKIIAILNHGGLCDSKELPTNIPLVSYVQTLRKNDSEQNITNHKTTYN